MTVIMSTYIRQLNEVTMQEVAAVGGKNASLGEMLSRLGKAGIHVPDGFATTAAAFRLFLEHNKLNGPLDELMQHPNRVLKASSTCQARQYRYTVG
ncbi:hypothetical protein HB364_22245 [Pseudoflavitalea sp. X16]|nr:hypothetical protein [Paraflavitalea devenefica]